MLIEKAELKLVIILLYFSSVDTTISHIMSSLTEARTFY